MNPWTNMAIFLHELFRELMLSGFNPSEALHITTEVAKTSVIEGIRQGNEGMK